jgi:hypothetical protein
MLERIVAPAIVVAIVTDDGGEFWVFAEIVFSFVREKFV